MGSSELQVAARPELGRLLVVSKVVECGDLADETLGEASLDDAEDLARELASDVLILFRPCDRRKAKGESPEEERELRLVESEERFLPSLLSLSLSFSFSFSFWPLLLSFLARCSPRSSRSGSVHMTSNMIGGVFVHVVCMGVGMCVCVLVCGMGGRRWVIYLQVGGLRSRLVLA